jgi:hypothetical protein
VAVCIICIGEGRDDHLRCGGSMVSNAETISPDIIWKFYYHEPAVTEIVEQMTLSERLKPADLVYQSHAN